MAAKNHHSLLLGNHHTCSCEFLELKTLLLTCERLSWIMFHVSSSQFLEISFAASKLTWAVNLLYKTLLCSRLIRWPYGNKWAIFGKASNLTNQNKPKQQNDFGAELRSWVMIMCFYSIIRIWLWESIWAQPNIQDINSNSLQKTIYLSPRGWLKKNREHHMRHRTSNKYKNKYKKSI